MTALLLHPLFLSFVCLWCFRLIQCNWEELLNIGKSIGQTFPLLFMESAEVLLSFLFEEQPLPMGPAGDTDGKSEPACLLGWAAGILNITPVFTTSQPPLSFKWLKKTVAFKQNKHRLSRTAALCFNETWVGTAQSLCYICLASTFWCSSTVVFFWRIKQPRTGHYLQEQLVVGMCVSEYSSWWGFFI